jgi:hypothetical protein
MAMAGIDEKRWSDMRPTIEKKDQGRLSAKERPCSVALSHSVKRSIPGVNQE